MVVAVPIAHGSGPVQGPAGIATVRSRSGSRATVGARVIEPVALAALSMHRRGNGPAGFVGLL